MYSSYGILALNENELQKNSVLHLANRAVNALVKEGCQFSHLLAATSCPDAIAPSLGQCLNHEFSETFFKTHTIDIVQGCSGGVSALILASQLSEYNKSNVLVVAADAAQKATSKTSDVYQVFNNGVYACCVNYFDGAERLIHYESRQFKSLYDVVTIGLGHDADAIIAGNAGEIITDSRKFLGLKLNNGLAIKLMKQAECFYLDFISITGHPDVLILHQVNELIVDHLEQVFSKYPVRFINVAKQTRNCGCATTGIVLDMIKDEVKNNRVMICSFGTGGIIVAGLWQF